ncbi:13862_t:CDS:2 [Acaulospora morrowiae]|uniref:13862_t:CDS:1 n=1 Tax=Acaulospora morrowiae TaxID=94023 RepID=A0A9N9A4I9_9GLOM|nr:13862_t:CDS:2 [Acaulospora morrowiae]
MVITRKTPKKTATRSATRAAKQEKAAAEASAKTEPVDTTSLLKVEPDGDVVMTPQNESVSGTVAEDEATSEGLTMASAPYETNPETSPINNFPTPLNLNVVVKKFKNPHYRPSRKYKNVKQMLVAERKENMPLDIPTYSNIEAPPSIVPQKKYCDITGLEAKYTDPKTRLRYHSAEIYREIKQMAPGVVQDYLGLRHAAVILR